ncbi:bifunctional transcriptional activator/DNA repair enzyme AdaA [Vibrio rhizosphaerae]|uniref:bifunctional transcriptional activator/DNA repair enzyme AdaA n=1 Tax=Vibrio rhizosphaerae TaxID=398736 RepID=UPI00056DE344|nr:Ada metal-binding domain-containing protein [Vibrio rhizosphaerae]
MLDFATCDKARLERDPQYDGVFFVAVITSKIYCRTVCPVRQPLSKNVTYFQTASAAEAAGYRPCLRCRPETAPFSPAWNGTLTTVKRAMRLIDEGALDGTSVAVFAARLGVGSRHLSRLFQQHVGASPVQVARTKRLQKAKRMLDNTDLKISSIAFQAGYGSLRQFNACFLEKYRLSPSQYRKKYGSLKATI